MSFLRVSLKSVYAMFSLAMVLCSLQLSAVIVRSNTPLIKNDGADHKVVIYLAENDAGQWFTKAMYWNGSLWSTPTTISSSTRSVFDPVLVSEPQSGHVLAAWCAYDPNLGINVVEASTWSASGGWSAVATLSNTTAEDARIGDVQAYINPSDGLQVVWSSYLNNVIRVRGAAGTFGGSWSSPITLSN